MSITNASVRVGTSAEWAASTLVMVDGELGLDRDLNEFKVGDGTNVWSALTFAAGSHNATATTAQLNSLTSDINTIDKYIGKQVTNTTTGIIVSATDATAGGVWRLASTGATTYSPV